MDTYLMLMGSSAASKGGSGSSSWLSLVMLLGLFAVMYFLMIRPQKKREKAEAAMRSSLEIGDQVVTVGGIVGKVVTLKDDESIVIETGTDRTKLRITRTAIFQNNTASEKAADKKQAKIDAIKAAKKKDSKDKESSSFEEK